ncbi:RNase HII [Planifilum fulgidum]|jgi:ribonuclease HII|uniref:Ribonuclease HII n=1 Tax=Planifilum fulgidum TaxID=201973 RepID=A0A1I2R643_9BACL|nr:ribonuclease HII [Planifilum fulgidum]MBO2496765.1 ribonuclease HII [Bacillota bacterium]MBO2532343.1 ribonuclease HII [Thermoactinomycetaceae bacterium]SFG36174.1 RNase HII [Planifilum fulgidum]
MKVRGTIREIEEWLAGGSGVSRAVLEELLRDPRAGVRQIALRHLRKLERMEREAARLERMWQTERTYWAKGYGAVAGLDEAGRGCLAGPVVAAAVILPEDFDVSGLNDSKQLSPAEREELRGRIDREATAVGIGMADVEYIDAHNILQATYEAMRRAVSNLPAPPDALLVDALTVPGLAIPQQAIIKGDSLSHSIAAASIVAKTERDRWMEAAAARYPEYGFDRNKGYATPDHLAALDRWGPCPLHRRSFAPVRERLQGSLFPERSMG